MRRYQQPVGVDIDRVERQIGVTGCLCLVGIGNRRQIADLSLDFEVTRPAAPGGACRRRREIRRGSRRARQASVGRTKAHVIDPAGRVEGDEWSAPLPPAPPSDRSRTPLALVKTQAAPAAAAAGRCHGRATQDQGRSSPPRPFQAHATLSNLGDRLPKNASARSPNINAPQDRFLAKLCGAIIYSSIRPY